METLAQSVIGPNGKPAGNVELDPTIFAAKVLPQLVHMTVRWQLSKRRAGTHSVLTRSMMEGGAKKPWKQKGSGRARAGSSIAPHWVGGAVVHGPTPRDYEMRLSKRTRRQALLSVLTDKRTHGKLMVVNAITAEGNKTRNLVAWLRERGIGEGESALLVLAPGEEGVARAARNIEGVITLPVCGVNVYDLLRYGYVVCTPESLGLLQKRLRTPEKGEVSEAAA